MHRYNSVQYPMGFKLESGDEDQHFETYSTRSALVEDSPSTPSKALPDRNWRVARARSDGPLRSVSTSNSGQQMRKYAAQDNGRSMRSDNERSETAEWSLSARASDTTEHFASMKAIFDQMKEMASRTAIAITGQASDFASTINPSRRGRSNSGTCSLRRSGAIGTASRSSSYRARDGRNEGHASRLGDKEYDRTMMERGAFAGRTGTNILDPSFDDSRTTLPEPGIDMSSFDTSFPLPTSQRSKKPKSWEYLRQRIPSSEVPIYTEEMSRSSHRDEKLMLEQPPTRWSDSAKFPKHQIPRKSVGQGKRTLIIGVGREMRSPLSADDESVIRKMYDEPLTRAFGTLRDTGSRTSRSGSNSSDWSY